MTVLCCLVGIPTGRAALRPETDTEVEGEEAAGFIDGDALFVAGPKGSAEDGIGEEVATVGDEFEGSTGVLGEGND